jgi:hypothetical protein
MSRRKGVPMPPWAAIEAQSSKPAGRANPIVPETIEEPASRATPRPLDEEGIPFLTTHDVAPHLGISHVPNFKEAAYREVPHYVDTKSGSAPQSVRVYFSMKDIADHFAIKSGSHLPPEKKNADQLSFGARYKLWSERHQNALRNLDEQRKQGINPGNLYNQPHPGNKDIHTRLVRGVRYQSEDDPATGDLQGRITGLGSNVANPIKFGQMKPVEGTSADTTDFLDPNRPRRGR